MDEAVKINPKIKSGKNYFFCFEPDRILYYNQLKKLNYLPEDIHSNKYNLASKMFISWKRRDQNVIKNYVTEIHTLSDYVTKQTEAIYKNKKVRKTTDLYVDMSNFKIKSKEDSRQKIENHYKFGIKKDDILILSQSRVEKSKGILELISAIKKLNRDKGYPGIKLLIGGRGDMLETVKNKIKDMDNAFLLGFVPNELLQHIYGAADIFVALPRKETGGPLTILEGMYAGAIVIGTIDAGPAEIIVEGKNGFVADPNNENQIIEKIKKAYKIKTSNPKRFKEITSKAKQEVKTKFTFENFYRRLTGRLS